MMRTGGKRPSASGVEILALQQVRCETLGTIAAALRAENLSVKNVRIFEEEPVPEGMGRSAGLIVMGGPMGVYERERYPFLSQEIRLIEKALRRRKPVLGVCLGSQLLAAALGTKVMRGKAKEIGWHPVTLLPAAGGDRLWAGLRSPFMGYHWHGDVFDLPAGAVRLASSDHTPCQAFRYGETAYGILFHAEVTYETIAGMVRAFPDELREAGIDGRQIARMSKSYLPELSRIGKIVFRRWAGLIKEKQGGRGR